MLLPRRHVLQMISAASAAACLPQAAAWSAPGEKKTPAEKKSAADKLQAADSNDKGVKLGAAVKQRWRVGVVVRAQGGPCAGLFMAIPIPMEWPEQEVQTVEENLSPHVKDIKYRTLNGGAKQMLVSVPNLPAGSTATALLTFEVMRKPATPPADTTILKRAERTPAHLAPYLNTSPLIESRDEKIRTLVREILKEKSELNDWQKVEAMYDWVQDNIKYQNGKLKGALAALKDKTGDCEELTSLFIALCRASKIPARTVWVPGHCYAEFYLVDDEGVGHWIPCNLATDKQQFGELPDPRPVLQKGDAFRVPELGETQRYAAEVVKGSKIRGSGSPEVEWKRDLLPPGA